MEQIYVCAAKMDSSLSQHVARGEACNNSEENALEEEVTSNDNDY